jgi:hypothetical protein
MFQFEIDLALVPPTFSNKYLQGFQSVPVPGNFTRLRLCIVPAENTEPPKISGGQNHKYDRLVEYFSIKINQIQSLQTG